MKTSVKLDRWECDGCGDVQLVDPKGVEQVPYGFQLRVQYDIGSGGGLINAFACSLKCVEEAVRTAVSR